ncbi:hypothetical protein [Mycobacteroides abscessus]|uniref:hypothetical protein n=1 Tax=Mycobacteroides abscessus TaxID=36809 RepID=UPI000C268AF2|nr:hypothetical protein [Mycobacteroides abscessus]
MTYPQHPQPRPSNPSHVFAWAALGLAVLGVLLGVAAGSVAHEPCKAEQKAYIESTYPGGTDRPGKERIYRQCQAQAKTTSTTLVTLSVFSLLGAAGAGVAGAVAYNSSPAARERKRQRAWAAYYAAQQSPHNPAASATAPTEDYDTYTESAPDEEPTAPAPEPEPEIPWYMKGDK